MKRVVLVTGLLLSVSALPVLAGNNGPGCGLGQQVFKGSSGLSAHSSAATTNGSFSNQLFGITSGSLGCNQDAVVSNDLETKVFVASNMDSLAQDVAQGGGAYLSSLAALMGIDEKDKSDFYSFTQQNYETLFKAEDSTYEDVLASLDDAMTVDSRFVTYVR